MTETRKQATPSSREGEGAGWPRASRFPVLLVEDNPGDVFVITEIIKDWRFPFELQVAVDGEMALSLVDRYESDDTPCPALVLLDLNLPRVSGAEVLARLRQSPRCQGVPVVVVTSSDSCKDMDAVKLAGANAYFRKPTDLSAYRALGKVILDVLPAAGGHTPGA